MEHVYDIFSLVKEMYRILKPGGYFIAGVPNIAYLKHRLSLLLGKLPVTSSPYNWEEIGWDGGHIHYFTIEKFCWLFESQGFRLERKRGSGFLAKFRNWYPSLLCGDIVIKARKAKEMWRRVKVVDKLLIFVISHRRSGTHWLLINLDII